MVTVCTCVIELFLMAALGSADVLSYEATSSFPEAQGWVHDTFCTPERWLENGWLVQHVEVSCGGPPGGDKDRYERSLAEFAGADKFFFQWRMQTDGDRSEIGGVSPASFTTADLFGVSYHFTIARDQVRLIRDNFLPITYVDVSPEVPHVYRLELYGENWYVWYIDTTLVDAGIPEGAYPTPTGVLSWRAKPWYLDSTTRWDYIRFGIIPEDGSGDYNSDEDVDSRDFYFFHECLSNRRPGINGGPGNNAGPGCRFADFDSDSDVDLLDYAEFQVNFTGNN